MMTNRYGDWIQVGGYVPVVGEIDPDDPDGMLENAYNIMLELYNPAITKERAAELREQLSDIKELLRGGRHNNHLMLLQNDIRSVNRSMVPLRRSYTAARNRFKSLMTPKETVWHKIAAYPGDDTPRPGVVLGDEDPDVTFGRRKPRRRVLKRNPQAVARREKARERARIKAQNKERLENLVRGHRRAPPKPLIDDEDPALPIFRTGAQEEYAYPNYTDITPELEEFTPRQRVSVRDLPRMTGYTLNYGDNTVTVQYDDGSTPDIPLPPGNWVTNDGRIKTAGNKKYRKDEERVVVQRLANEYRRSNPFE